MVNQIPWTSKYRTIPGISHAAYAVLWPMLTQNSAGNEVKANTAYTRAQEYLFIVGNLNIPESSKIERNSHIEFILESLIALRGRKAFKHFGTDKSCERVSGVVFEESEDARFDGLLTKGSCASPQVASNSDELVDGVGDLAISVETNDQQSLRARITAAFSFRGWVENPCRDC